MYEQWHAGSPYPRCERGRVAEGQHDCPRSLVEGPVQSWDVDRPGQETNPPGLRGLRCDDAQLPGQPAAVSPAAADQAQTTSVGDCGSQRAARSPPPIGARAIGWRIAMAWVNVVCNSMARSCSTRQG